MNETGKVILTVVIIVVVISLIFTVIGIACLDKASNDTVNHKGYDAEISFTSNGLFSTLPSTVGTLRPASGYEFALVTFTVTNTGEKNINVDMYDLKLCVSNQLFTASVDSLWQTQTATQYSSGGYTLMPGGTATFTLVYEAPHHDTYSIQTWQYISYNVKFV